MPSVFRKPKSPFFFAAYRDAQGKRVQKTTKQKNRTKAMELARGWEKLAARGREGVLTEAHARKVVSEILESVTGERLHIHTCRAWLNEWVAGKRGTVGEKLIGRYEQVIRDFLTHIGTRADLTLEAINHGDIRSFRDAQAKGKRSAGTVNQTIRGVLSVPFYAAVKLGHISRNPCAAVEMLRAESETSRETFTPEQVQKLIGAAKGDWKGVILAAYFTGLRLRDVVELQWGAIEGEVLRVKTRKTGIALTIPLHYEITDWLGKHTPRGIGQAPIFPTLTGKPTGGSAGLSTMFAGIMKKAEIKGKVKSGKGRATQSLTFHSLRHSFVSALANAGVTAELRQRLSGHADAEAHARYTHHEIETLADAIKKLPSVLTA